MGQVLSKKNLLLLVRFLLLYLSIIQMIIKIIMIIIMIIGEHVSKIPSDSYGPFTFCCIENHNYWLNVP